MGYSDPFGPIITMVNWLGYWLGFILDPHDSQWLYGPYRWGMGGPHSISSSVQRGEGHNSFTEMYYTEAYPPPSLFMN